MANHFEAVGLKVNSIEDLEFFYSQCAELGTVIDTKSGKYFFWNMGSGAELWGQLDSNNDAGINPHFSGESLFEAVIENEIKDDEKPIMDGSLYCQSVHGQFPFAVDIPNLAAKNIEFPQTCSLQISAFAHNINIYESEEDYDKQNTQEPKFATEHFLPSGLFTEEGQTATAHAIFGGWVIKTEKRKNPVTGLDFYYALVKTYGGEIDVVIPPDLMENEDKLQKNSILSGSFWLSARIAE